jgi:polar amino acid transport system substrate-binding protein
MDTPSNGNPSQPEAPQGQQPVSSSATTSSVPPQPVPTQPAQPAAAGQPQVEQLSLNHKSNRTFIFMIGGLIVLLIAGLLGALLVFRQELGKENKPVVETVVAKKDHGKIIIGTDATYPPMEYYDEKKELVGFDIDLGKQLGQEIQKEVEFKVMTWDDLFPAVEKGEIDAIISSVTITDERKTKYEFSEPYLNAGQVFITKRASGSGITKTDVMTGKKIGVQKETTSEKEAMNHTSKDLVISYNDYVEAAASLSAGMIDTIMIDLTGAKGILEKNPDFVIASDPLTNEFYGIVLKKGNTEMKKQLDTAIAAFQQRGILENLKNKWFQ